MQRAKVGKFIVNYENAEEFRELRREIWVGNAYYFETDEEAPTIIDLGAHIGLTVLYWKQLYPKAKIQAFEPNPTSFAMLAQNMVDNGIEGVELFQKAVSPRGGQLTLHEDPDWRSTMGIIPAGWRGIQKTKSLTVESEPIANIIVGEISLLKMDIEGMEYEGLGAANLKRVKNIIVEVHPRAGHKSDEVEKLLRSRGFRVERSEDKSPYGKGLAILTAAKIVI